MTELPIVSEPRQKKPDWLRVKLPIGEEYKHVRSLVDTHKLHTICESGNCPNMGECWGAGTATFMILGNMKVAVPARSEEHTSELQSHSDLVCRLLLEKKKIISSNTDKCNQTYSSP